MLYSRGAVAGAALAEHDIAGGNFVVDVAAAVDAEVFATSAPTKRNGLVVLTRVSVSGSAAASRRSPVSSAVVLQLGCATVATRRTPTGGHVPIAVTSRAGLVRRATLAVAASLDLMARLRVRWRHLHRITDRRTIDLAEVARRVPIAAGRRCVTVPAERDAVLPHRKRAT